MQKKGDRINIVLTGGHGGTPGIAVARELRARFPNSRLMWIGSRYAMPGAKVTTLEYKVFPKIGVEFYSLIPGKLQTKFTRYTIPLLLNIPLSFLQAFWFVLRLKPKAIVSFGGFSSFPVIFWGWVLGIPVILHEQTVVAGRSAISSAFFARKIALARSESLRYFPSAKTVITGNPLPAEILAIKPKKNPEDVKTILVFGGSRGSEFVNEEISKIVPELTKKYKVLHVTGERDFEKYKEKEAPNYKVYGYVDPIRERPGLYTQADLIIGRAGANTVSEIIYIKRPAILIPLPRTYMDEQSKNAEFAKEFGIARVMQERDVNPKSLMSEIENVFSNWDKILQVVIRKPSPDGDATINVVDLVERFL